MSVRAIFGQAWLICIFVWCMMFAAERDAFDDLWHAYIWWIDSYVKPLPWVGSIVEYAWRKENADLWWAFTGRIFDALLPALVVTAVVDLALDYNEAQQILATIKRVFAGEDPNIFSNLTDEVKGKIVRNSLVTTLGTDYGAVVYDEIVFSYFGRRFGYRKAFRYEVRFEESLPDVTGHSAALSPIVDGLRKASSEYLWANQDVSYTRHGFSSSESLPHLHARFALSHSLLNRLISSELLFFRELLRVPESVRQQIELLDDNQVQELFRRVFGFRALHPATGKELSSTVRWATDEAGERFIEVEIVNPSGRLEGSGCRLVFALPHKRSEAEFLVTFATPVEAGAKIRIRGSSSMKNLRYIPFLSRFVPHNFDADERTTNLIAIDTKVWVFPTSGLMILWDS